MLATAVPAKPKRWTPRRRNHLRLNRRSPVSPPRRRRIGQGYSCHRAEGPAAVALTGLTGAGIDGGLEESEKVAVRGQGVAIQPAYLSGGRPDQPGARSDSSQRRGSVDAAPGCTNHSVSIVPKSTPRQHRPGRRQRSTRGRPRLAHDIECGWCDDTIDSQCMKHGMM